MHTQDVGAATTVLYVPKAHAVHTRDVAAAATVPYVPAEQLVHADEVAFAWLLYVPALQLAQVSTVELEAKYEPGAHTGQG